MTDPEICKRKHSLCYALQINENYQMCHFCIFYFAECDCDPDGTIDEGECDGYTDEEDGMIAGQCHCKTYVDGQRCDRCKNGYWNFTAENPDGCQGK